MMLTPRTFALAVFTSSLLSVPVFAAGQDGARSADPLLDWPALARDARPAPSDETSARQMAHLAALYGSGDQGAAGGWMDSTDDPGQPTAAPWPEHLLLMVLGLGLYGTGWVLKRRDGGRHAVPAAVKTDSAVAERTTGEASEPSQSQAA